MTAITNEAGSVLILTPAPAAASASGRCQSTLRVIMHGGRAELDDAIAARNGLAAMGNNDAGEPERGDGRVPLVFARHVEMTGGLVQK